MKVKNDFEWHNTFSVIAESIIIKAGAPVQKSANEYFVHPRYFPVDSIARHDAMYYGCRVQPDNVETV